jgi:outer membrane protein OmpA-like peptidoglycan-associated protein
VVVPPVIADAIEQVEHELVAYFDHDSADMNDIEATDSVGVIVGWLRTTPDAGLNILGHTDSTGDEAYNEALSFRRAEAAKALFVEQGVEPHRIKTFGFGETSLLVQIFGRERQNRRVEIEVFHIEEYVPLVFPLPTDEE